MTYFCLKPDIYPLTFHVFFGKWDRKEARKKAGVPKGEQLLCDHPDGLGRCWDFGCHQMIWVEDKEKLHLLVHEITHASLHAGAKLGFTLCPGRTTGLTDCDAGAEFYAYLSQWLVKEVLQALRKKKR